MPFDTLGVCGETAPDLRFLAMLKHYQLAERFNCRTDLGFSI